jgi:hypothetical protein
MQVAQSPTPSKEMIFIRQPIGVVGMITPWNFPNAMITRKVSSSSGPCPFCPGALFVSCSDLSRNSVLMYFYLKHKISVYFIVHLPVSHFVCLGIDFSVHLKFSALNSLLAIFSIIFRPPLQKIFNSLLLLFCVELVRSQIFLENAAEPYNNNKFFRHVFCSLPGFR